MRAATAVFVLGLVCLVAHVRAQDEDAGAEGGAAAGSAPQPSEADLAIMEKLMAALSAECREEMQRSMKEQTDLPQQCQQEIQQIIMSGKLGNRPGARPSGAAPAAEEAPEEPVPFYANPVLHITIFLIAFFGAIGYYIYFVNAELEKVRKQHPKKTSAKKNKKRETWSISG